MRTRIQQTPYVFDGTVTRVERDKLTIQVSTISKARFTKYRLVGIKSNLMSKYINKTAGRYLFFTQPLNKNNWFHGDLP
ncbi:MAG: hypothetical protein HC903_05880 [Methylacidiphilales bacterium]|nr:hypothetical protein [Candidatus Methylacidiphilales bacterium]NJR17877.1 hypothetical protein [Calothrix sp. CSU_2_0]